MIEVRPSPIQGMGVFALRPIPKGTRVVEYIGERISHAESDRRYDDDAMGRAHTFLFIVDDATVIDAAVGGNEARFINHSCAPNCESLIEAGRVWIETIRNIARGEELSYDYQLERPGRYRQEYEQEYACHCGAPTCRGILLVKPKKPRQRKRSR
ncbi:MAG: SET domain-containing protein-lysine N-methyltransferase [Anaerolineae bacterium]